MKDDNGQLLLPFDFVEKEAAPPDFSGLPNFDAPKNDNERLLNYQYAAKHGDKSAFVGMYKLGVKVALRYIGEQATRNKHIESLSEPERKEKAHNAVTYIIARYYGKNDFYIKKSFTSYLYLRVLHELFYRRKVDDLVEFVDMEKLKRIAQ